LSIDTQNDPYNHLVRALFANPDHAGVLEGGIVVSNADQGIRIELSARVTEHRVERLRYRAWGCPHCIAACEALAAKLEGGPTGDLENFSSARFMQSLAVPAEKSARILVIEDTVRQLGKALRDPTASERQN